MLTVAWPAPTGRRLRLAESRPPISGNGSALQAYRKLTEPQARESARPLCPNLCEHRLRNAETGLLKLSDGHVEIDETGLFSFIENGKRAGNPQAPANGFLPSRLLVHEYDIGMHLRTERDRLALPQVELPEYQAGLWTQDLDPCRHVDRPVLDRFRRNWMLQFRQHDRWNQNSLV